MKQSRLVLRQLVKNYFKILVILVVMAAFWIGSAYAYTGTGLYVNAYGNVGSAYFSQSDDNREAKTYTSVTIYYQAVTARHWHLGALEWNVQKEKYSGTTTSLATYASGTYGVDAAQHAFYGAPGTGFNYYYTTPVGTTTYSWWACGNSTC